MNTYTCDACGKAFEPGPGKLVYPKIRVILDTVRPTEMDEEDDRSERLLVDFCRACKDRIMELLNRISLENPTPLPDGTRRWRSVVEMRKHNGSVVPCYPNGSFIATDGLEGMTGTLELERCEHG
jgi:hypothetical protein